MFSATDWPKPHSSLQERGVNGECSMCQQEGSASLFQLLQLIPPLLKWTEATCLLARYCSGGWPGCYLPAVSCARLKKAVWL